MLARRSGGRPSRRKALGESFRSSRAICRGGGAFAWRPFVSLAAGACVLRRSRLPWVRSRFRPSGCSPKAIFTASGNAAATPAAGCSMIAARTTADGGAKWRFAAIAPNSGGSRPGGVRLEASAGAFLIFLTAAATLGGCSPALETDQARLCRMALPALMAEDARIAILKQAPDPDGRGLRIAFTAETRGEEPRNHLVACRFREPGRPRKSRDLVALALDGRALVGNAALLSHSLLAGDAGGSSGRSRASRRLERPSRCAARGRLWFADGAGGLPLASIYALLAAAYSLVYALIGRINFAFGEIAAAGGYAAAIAALAMLGWPPAPLLIAAFVLAARLLPPGDSRRRTRCSFRCARRAASRCWWRAWASRFSCASFCVLRRATGRAG